MKIGRLFSLLGVLAIAAVMGLGVNFWEVRLGPAFLLLASFCLPVGGMLIFGKRVWAVPLGLLALLPAGAYLWWRTMEPAAISLAEADRQLIVLAAVGVIIVGCWRAMGGVLADRMLLIFLWLFATVNFGVACFQTWGDPAFMVHDAGVMVDSQASGFMTHHNPFASLMGGLLGYAIAGVFLLRNKATRLISLVTVGFCVVAVVLSQSRGGTLALGLTFVVALIMTMLLKYSRKDRDAGKMVIVGIITIIGMVALSGLYVAYVEGARGKDLLGGGIRPALFQMGVGMFFEEPVFGHGPRAFSYMSAQQWDFAKNGWAVAMPEFAHNEYLQMLVDYGSVGLLSVVLVLGLAGISGFIRVFTPTESNETGDVLLVGAIAGISGFLLQCFFSFLAHVPTNLMFVAIHVGILFGWREVTGAIGVGRAIVSRSVGVILIGACVWFAVWGTAYSKSLLRLDAVKKGVLPLEEVQALYEVGETTRQSKYFVEGAATAIRQIETAASEKEAEQWMKRAGEGYWRGYELNPEAPESASGYATTLDYMRDYESARRWHEVALKNAGGLAFRLGFSEAMGRSLFQLAVSKISKDPNGGEADLRKAITLLKSRIRVNEAPEVFKVRQKQRVFALKWISYLEGRRLYLEGDRVWKKRKAGRGMALMLAARKRYQRSRAEISEFEPGWQVEWEQLEKNLTILKGAKIVPEKIPREEIEAIALGPFKDGLDSGTKKR